MHVSKEDFDRAVLEGLISADQAEALWLGLQNRHPNGARFDFTQVMYYCGALIVMSAMGWFMTAAWRHLGGIGMLAVSTLYAVCFLLAGRTLWYKEKLKVPGGLLFTMAVWMVPLAIYGFERLTGIWPQGDPGIYRNYHMWIKGSWFFMELGTIIAGLVALRFIRFPFLTAPVAFALWYMSMDLTPLLFGKTEFTWDEGLQVSLWFGLAMLLVSYGIDRRTKDDYAFWGYLFGLAAFSGGLTLMVNDGPLNRFLYCLINLGLMTVAILLQRRAFLVFGSLGVVGYLGYLAHKVYKDSLLFPFGLSLIGILVIYLGIRYHRNGQALERFLLARLPAGIRRLLPGERPLPWTRVERNCSLGNHCGGSGVEGSKNDGAKT